MDLGFGLGRAGGSLRVAVLAVVGDAGVGAGFPGVAHDAGQGGVGGRVGLRLRVGSGDGLGVWVGGCCCCCEWWRWMFRVGLRTGWLFGIGGQRDFFFWCKKVR